MMADHVLLYGSFNCSLEVHFVISPHVCDITTHVFTVVRVLNEPLHTLSLLQALDGFLLVFSDDGTILFASQTVNKYLGLTQVGDGKGLHVYWSMCMSLCVWWLVCACVRA